MYRTYGIYDLSELGKMDKIFLIELMASMICRNLERWIKFSYLAFLGQSFGTLPSIFHCVLLIFVSAVGHFQLFRIVYGKTLSILISYTLAMKLSTFRNKTIFQPFYTSWLYLNIGYQNVFAQNHLLII